MAARDCIATLLALFLPPVAVWMVRGCGAQLCINLLLCLLGFIPGMVHALFIICATDNKEDLPTSSAPPPQPQPQYQPPVNPPYPAGPPQGPPVAQPYYPAQPAPGYPSQPPAGYPSTTPQYPPKA